MTTTEDICRRIAQVRAELAGPRGRAAFAAMVGVAASTYQNYESSRVPPAPVLVRIADAAGVSLRWLLTGEAPGSGEVPADHPVVQRAAALIGERPNAAAPLAAFLDILSASLGFPSTAEGADEAPAMAAAPPAPPAEGPVTAVRGAQAPAPPEAPRAEPRRAWIPILGRSAAGVPQFWADAEEAAGVTMLDDLIARHAGRADEARQPATARAEGPRGPRTVQLITLASPGEDEAAEFIDAAGVKAGHADAFALRIDGDSMAPDIRHGDLVVLSPSVPAAGGRPAVVQLRGQIGVTCKLFRREGETVHLIPVNEQHVPQSFPAADVCWALRVLARVRPGAEVA